MGNLFYARRENSLIIDLTEVDISNVIVSRRNKM